MEVDVMNGGAVALRREESGTRLRAADVRTRAAKIQRRSLPWTLAAGLGAVLASLAPLPMPIVLAVTSVLLLLATGLGIVTVIRIAALMHIKEK